MTRLLIGNDFDDDVRGDRTWASWWVQRVLWFARDGDILLVPEAPEAAFLDYVTALTGVDAGSLQMVVPPEHEAGPLTARQISGTEIRELVREAVGGHPIEAIFALWPSPAVAALASAIDAEDAMPGHAFVSQGGGRLLNSKSAFRAIAAGAGVPLLPGTVCSGREAAEDSIVELSATGHPLVLKHDYMSGGRGNEIVSPLENFRPIGARRVTLVEGRSAAGSYLDERWDWLSGGGRHAVVVERYARDSSAFFAEFVIDDDTVRFAGHGELLSAPFAIGQVMPAHGLDALTLESLVDGGARLCGPLKAMGYRGVLSADAVVTPAGEVFFTEYNGRVTGSTHIYGEIGMNVIGDDYGNDRTILERVWPSEWEVTSFSDAVARVSKAGLGYDPSARSGVIFTNAFDPKYRGVMYCIAAPTLDEAWHHDAQLKAIFGVADS